MQIISGLGVVKALSADISVIRSPFGSLQSLTCAKVTSTTAIAHTAGQCSAISWNSVIFDSGNMAALPATRLYIPQGGWYLANAYVSTDDAVAHDAVLQIHSSRLSSFVVYNKVVFGAGSATFENGISATGMAYMETGDSFYVYWGTTQAITSLTGETNIGFGVWKLA